MNKLRKADKEHIEQLARELGVKLYSRASGFQRAADNRDYRTMLMLEDGVSFTAPDRSTYLLGDWDTPDLGYFIALHELGHQAGNHCALKIGKGFNGLTRADILRTEVEAWQWAFANCRRSPEPETWKTIKRAINTYREATAQELGTHA